MYRIFVVDDHPVVRQGLKLFFERDADLRVCGEAADVEEALDGIAAEAPDAVVTDVMLETGSGLDLTRALRRAYPILPVLVVSMHDEDVYAQRALSAGASGYVMKCCCDDELMEALREVLAGRLYVSRALRQRHDGLPDGAPRDPVDTLSDRELDIFLLIGQGLAPRHIAHRLGLSPSTVEAYRERIKTKLGIESAALLVRYAVLWGRDHPHVLFA